MYESIYGYKNICMCDFLGTQFVLTIASQRCDTCATCGLTAEGPLCHQKHALACTCHWTEYPRMKLNFSFEGKIEIQFEKRFKHTNFLAALRHIIYFCCSWQRAQMHFKWVVQQTVCNFQSTNRHASIKQSEEHQKCLVWSMGICCCDCSCLLSTQIREIQRKNIANI